MEKSNRYVVLGIGVLVATITFITGFYLGMQEEEHVIIIEPTANENVSISTRVLVSSRGRAYYPWWCSSGDSISPKNRKWFSSSARAEQAGYKIAKACAVK